MRIAARIILVQLGALTGLVARAAPPAQPSIHDGEQISAAIRDLGHATYERRTQATRRLVAAGVRAYEQLRSAADDSRAEIALRAKGILELIDELWFAGVEVSLSLSRERASWRDPVDLLITLTNTSTHRARVPFDLDRERRSAPPSDARQVGDMLDAAEWVRVRGSDERDIELRVDEAGGDVGVSAALQERVRGEPGGALDPGESVTLRVESINRGWARFVMLDRGDYALTLEYVPAWDDEELLRARAGRVVSNTVVLSITDSAPDLVSRRGVVSAITVEREGNAFVARAVNRSDQPMLINTNYGMSPPFAQGRWVFESGGVTRDVALSGKAGAGYSDFCPGKIVKAEPGAATELARITIDELRAGLARGGVDAGVTAGEIHFGYANMLTRQWQQRQPTGDLESPDVPAALREPLSRFILSGWHTSDRLRWSND